MAITYYALAKASVGSGGTAYIEFTEISNGYTDLIVYYSLRSNRSATIDNLVIEFNGSTSDEKTVGIAWDGGSNQVYSNNTFNFSFGAPGNSATSNSFGAGYMYIPNYSSSTVHPFNTSGVDSNNASGVNSAQVGDMGCIWNNASPITSIRIRPNIGTLWLQHSTATLYGIKKA